MQGSPQTAAADNGSERVPAIGCVGVEKHFGHVEALRGATLTVLKGRVTVLFGDTHGSPFGYGTYASRSAAVGAIAVYHAL